MMRGTAVAVPGSIRLRTSDVACTAHPTMIKTNVAQAGTVSGHAPGPLRTPATGFTRAGTRVVTKTIATTTVAERPLAISGTVLLLDERERAGDGAASVREGGESRDPNARKSVV